MIEAVRNQLERDAIPYCLIGATALAAHGFARQSQDVDLLCMDDRVLGASYWIAMVPAPEIREGDATDPLRGLVRFPSMPPLDLIVGRGHAARLAVETAVKRGEGQWPLCTPLALTLLKLEAGSGQDRADIVNLVATHRAAGRAAWTADIATHLAKLSQDAREAWTLVDAELTRLPR